MRAERRERHKAAREARRQAAIGERARRTGGVIVPDPSNARSDRCVWKMCTRLGPIWPLRGSSQGSSPTPMSARFTVVSARWTPRPRSPAFTMGLPHSKQVAAGDGARVMLPWGGIPIRTSSAPSGDDWDLIRAHRKYVRHACASASRCARSRTLGACVAKRAQARQPVGPWA